MGKPLFSILCIGKNPAFPYHVLLSCESPLLVRILDCPVGEACQVFLGCLTERVEIVMSNLTSAGIFVHRYVTSDTKQLEDIHLGRGSPT